MTEEQSRTRTLGSLHSADGRGTVRMQDRYDTDVTDLWSAITEPARLARWLGEIDGDLQPDGEFHAHFFASGWQGTGRVEECEPPHHLLLTTRDQDGANEGTIELTLTTDGEQTILVWEEQVPPELLPEYGAGIQVHVEDLAAYLRGGERCDAQARWEQLIPGYRELQATVKE